MPRIARAAPGGHAYHVFNRSAGKFRLFRTDADFDAFDRVIREAHEKHPLRILAYCVMSTHWHFVCWPRGDGDVTAFFRWLANTHAMRWRVAHRTVGYGHLYQGRFKSFPIQRDQHLLAACRYVERNPLSAGLVKRAQDWRHCSLWTREHGPDDLRAALSDWPTPRPADWTEQVNRPVTAAEIERYELSVRRSRPFGDDRWVEKTAGRLGLSHTLRPEGRPRKQPPAPDEKRGRT